MKKIISAILAVLMILALVSCGVKDKNVNEGQANENGQQIEENINNDTENKEPGKEDEKNENNNEDNTDNKKPINTTDKKPQTNTNTTPEAKPESKPETKPDTNTEVKPEEKPQQAIAAGQKLLADFKSKAGSTTGALALAEAVSQNSIIPFSAVSTPVEQGFLAGFGSTEIKGFKDGAMFGPMIGSIQFIGYVFELEDGTDVSAFISNLKASADLRWNICVEAEEMVVGSSGNKVFFVMCNKDLNSEE